MKYFWNNLLWNLGLKNSERAILLAPHFQNLIEIQENKNKIKMTKIRIKEDRCRNKMMGKATIKTNKEIQYFINLDLKRGKEYSIFCSSLNILGTLNCHKLSCFQYEYQFNPTTIHLKEQQIKDLVLKYCSKYNYKCFIKYLNLTKTYLYKISWEPDPEMMDDWIELGKEEKLLVAQGYREKCKKVRSDDH